MSFVTFLLTIQQTLIKEAVVCDFTNAEDVGILQFAYDDCSSILPKEQKVEVTYAVYTDQPEQERIAGFMCFRWVSTRHVTDTFLRQEIDVPDRVAIDTTPEECEIIRLRRTCGDHFMELQSGKWTFLILEPAKGFLATAREGARLCCPHASSSNAGRHRPVPRPLHDQPSLSSHHFVPLSTVTFTLVTSITQFRVSSRLR